ncbi:MAG: histidine phosphatase family protein [Bacilli bacterium]|nr:histidine phosphatase family protein [Bacilli bacterium]
MKTIYILRHSKPDSKKEENKSISLSHEGILLAKRYLNKDIFKNINNVYCSDYRRSYETGYQSNKKIIIDKRLGERIAGIVDNETLTPLQYFYKQVEDENYSFKNGETRKQIEQRMYNALMDIVNDNDSSIIITHGTSLTFLLMKLCKVQFPNNDKKIRKIIFNEKVIFNNTFNYLETFKLTFDSNKLINIESIGNYEDI